MAQFHPVDDQGRVWQVQDLLPPDQADEILATPWRELPHQPALQQECWRRRQVIAADDHALRYTHYINQCLPQINLALGTAFRHSTGHFWVDLPGFQVPLHTDGHLPTAMQIYWTVPDLTYGTGFYRYRNPDSLYYQFESRPNSGYIMLNHAREDGSQPLLWHAMLNPVPEGAIRVTSYWYFAVS
jgi:hypothetical protein